MENLIDGDFCSNNGGWQWSASTGVDASPYFRIFNPITQSEKFDPDGKYQMKFLGLTFKPTPESEKFCKMAPKSWNIHEKSRPSTSIIDLKFGRDRALNKYSEFKKIISDI